MQREFLQEKSLNRTSDNAEKSLNVDLSAKSRLIPFSTTAGMLSLNKLYTDERDACETYRMIFTVNPVCTNILYNAVTEPVYKEGSEDAINLIETNVERDNQIVFPDGTINKSGNTVDQVAAVRDTEYSHEKIGNFKYHCGYDIFNNHLLRSMDFQHIEKTLNTDNNNEFNTIFDYLVDYKGDVVERVVGESNGPFMEQPSASRSKIRLYQLDNIKPINLAFYDGLRQVDGWYGFYNSGNINIPNGTLNRESVSVNCILNNETRCEFIDLYPDRTLYSFIPKVNRSRKRLERNWDCSIVYPFKNDYDKFNEINGNNINAIKILNSVIVYDNVGNEQVQMQSLLRNTLKAGDQIRLFYSFDGGPINRYSVPVTVIVTGDERGENTNRYFKVKYYDIKTFCSVEDINEKNIVFFYKKIENGCDDRYYFRKFKEIRDYRYIETDCEGLTPPPTKFIKEPTVIAENSPRTIKLGDTCFKLEGKPLTYTQNKIAFGENIYGDRIAQVIFSDDICVTGLKDNLGRPLTTLYFMVLKTNRGHEKWYEEGNATDEKIEYSHCFGDITSGLDLPSGVTDYNVRCLHNVFKEDLSDSEYRDGLNAITENIPVGKWQIHPGVPEPIEYGLTLEYIPEPDPIKSHEFFGDIVEFNRADFMETPIEKVYHRFNTAQRECLKNKKYFDIHYDELVGDIYDVKPDNQN